MTARNSQFKVEYSNYSVGHGKERENTKVDIISKRTEYTDGKIDKW
jgi:hypothetical protein